MSDLIERLQAEVMKANAIMELMQPLHDVEISLSWKEQQEDHERFKALIAETVAALSTTTTSHAGDDVAVLPVSEVPDHLLHQWAQNATIVHHLDAGHEYVLKRNRYIAEQAIAWDRQQRSAPVSEAVSGAVSEGLPAWYGMSKPWPLHDVLSELIRGAEILLDEKDYDGHGHERIATAKKRAREILVGIGLALPVIPADSEQVEGDATLEGLLDNLCKAHGKTSTHVIEAKEFLRQHFKQSRQSSQGVALCRTCRGAGGVQTYYDGDLESSEPCPACHPDVKPAAWRFRWPSNHKEWQYTDEEGFVRGPRAQGFEYEPLYSHPALSQHKAANNNRPIDAGD